MLPSNIDLTERADFGSPSSMSMDTPVDLDLLDLDDFDTRNKMSSNEYNSLIRWESIFGRKRHINQKWDIFPRLGLNGAEDSNALCCIRCGKPIRIPWKNYGHRYPWGNCGLCFECNEKEETETWGKIPWNHNMNKFSSRNDERGYNLFNSK